LPAWRRLPPFPPEIGTQAASARVRLALAAWPAAAAIAPIAPAPGAHWPPPRTLPEKRTSGGQAASAAGGGRPAGARTVSAIARAPANRPERGRGRFIASPRLYSCVYNALAYSVESGPSLRLVDHTAVIEMEMQRMLQMMRRSC